jgi:hypothetical protein
VPPTVNDIVKHIQCEFADAQTAFPKLKDNQYVVSATLTLDVTNTEGLSPSLSYISPLAVTGTAFTSTVGGQLIGTQHRNISKTFTLDLEEEISEEHKTACQNRKLTSGIQGDLGLGEIISAGLQQSTEDEYYFVFPKTTTGNPPVTKIALPTFGSTIDFTVVYGLSGAGPNWTLTHFRGPGGLVGLTRSNKDTLVVSFSPACPNPNGCVKPGDKANRSSLPVSDKKGASDAAQAGVTRQILQNILPSVSP